MSSTLLVVRGHPATEVSVASMPPVLARRQVNPTGEGPGWKWVGSPGAPGGAPPLELMEWGPYQGFYFEVSTMLGWRVGAY